MENLEQVFYLEDVFASGQRELNAQLCESLLSRLVRPMLLGDWLSGRSGAMFPQVCVQGERKDLSTQALVEVLTYMKEGQAGGSEIKTLTPPPSRGPLRQDKNVIVPRAKGTGEERKCILFTFFVVACFCGWKEKGVRFVRADVLMSSPHDAVTQHAIPAAVT